MAAELSPFLLQPIFKPKIWAGKRLGELLPAPAGTGEAWLVSDLPGASCVVLDGPETGKTLADLVRERPVELLGEALAESGRFPLLVKVLDIGPPLSVQVHPDAAVARALGDGEVGKCEAWLVLAVEDDGAVLYGLDANTAADQIPELSRAGTLPERMPTFRPHAGEGVEIVPGTLHTAHGVLVLEVQEPCDITYRVYDYGRERGELHLEQARRCLQDATRGLARGEGPGWSPGRRELAPRSPFRFEAIQLAKGEEFALAKGLLGVVVVLEGNLQVGDRVVGEGQALVIPACAVDLRAHAASDLRAGYATPRP